MFNCLAVDIGAGSGRIMRCVVGDNGNVELTELSRFANDNAPADGHIRWNVTKLIADIKSGLQAAARERKPDSVAVDTWGVDYVLLDEKNRMIEEPVCYRDGRTAGMAGEFNSKFGVDRMKQLTGIQIMDINTVYQLYAAKKENPDCFKNVGRMLMVPDYIAYQLTGVMANEFTIATTSQMLDCSTRDWAPEILDAVGLPRKCLEKPVMPGTKIGTIRDLPGLEGVPFVMVGSHDTASAVAAAPADGKSDWAYVASGTWCLTGFESPEAFPTPRSFDLNFTNEGGVFHTWRVLKNLTGFWILRGFKDEVAGNLSYNEWFRQSEKEPLFRSLYDPNSEVFFNPESMKAAADGFFRKTGQPVPDSPAAYARAFTDSLALLFRKTIREADSISGRHTGVIHLMGGGAQNSQLCQATADATGCRVIAGPVEATSLGNAMVQAVAMNVVPDLAAARALIRNSFHPRVFQPENTEAWTEAAERFAKFC